MKDERGIALLMVVFVITFGSLIVFELGRTAIVDQQIGRSYSEGVQATFATKSGANLARYLLERTKDPEFEGTDSLLEPWSVIGAAQSLPIPGFFGEPRIAIIDESSKIDLNNIVVTKAPWAGLNPSDKNPPEVNFWMKCLYNLTMEVGLSAEQFEDGSGRTLGNMAFAPDVQTATIHDWIDSDTTSFANPDFPGDGTESSLPKEWFLNRKLNSLSEALMIPGITSARLATLSPYVKVYPPTPGRNPIPHLNVNTASIEVLRACELPPNVATEIITVRSSGPWMLPDLSNLIQKEQLSAIQPYLGTSSEEFTIYVRVSMPNVKKWLRALVRRSGAPGSASTQIVRAEIY